LPPRPRSYHAPLVAHASLEYISSSSELKSTGDLPTAALPWETASYYELSFTAFQSIKEHNAAAAHWRVTRGDSVNEHTLAAGTFDFQPHWQASKVVVPLYADAVTAHDVSLGGLMLRVTNHYGEVTNKALDTGVSNSTRPAR